MAAQGPRGGLGEGQVRIHGPGEEELFTSPIHTGQPGVGGGCQPSLARGPSWRPPSQSPRAVGAP